MKIADRKHLSAAHGQLWAAAICGALVFAPSEGRAVTVTSGDIVTISLSGLPSAVQQPAVFLSFGPADQFGPNEAVRVTLFDGGNVSLESHNVVSGPVSNPGLSEFFSSSTTNTGHFVLDQIVGSFDLTTVAVMSNNGLFVATVIPEITSATPVPAALPLFATGLGALGLLGWRRKKKAAALVA